MPEAKSTAPGSSSKNGRIHYIDGIRAFGAIAVVIVHILQMRGLRLETAGVIPGFDYSGGLGAGLGSDLIRMAFPLFLNLGTLALKLFIVVSGYTIMFPVVRSKDGMPKGGIKGYVKRRVKRIWPPYYAALALSILFILLVPGMNTLTFNSYHDIALPLSPGAVVTHALFIHTWFPQYAQTINTPMWSIAVEEQIYILFPLVLLPFWRRRNSLLMIVSAMVVAWLPMLFLPLEVYHSTRAWFLILFAFGAAGISINYSNRPREMMLREKVPWGWVSIGMMGLWFVASKIVPRLLGFDDPDSLMRLEAFTDVLFGGAAMSFLIHATEVWKVGIPKWSIVAMLNWKPAVQLGLFSYSLYLMHVPLLSMLTLVVLQLGFTGEMFYVVMLITGIPLVIGVTYLFHIIFERPFMPDAARKSTPAATPQLQAARSEAIGH
ncbi:MAG: acyltransferase [Anaerolineae bacterium]|nr:acyltransferase [Anaerolineae bacterium]